ncbi:hypothetical protein SARC_04136 [Sphaeroforma arctica JP610]|uniref:Nucleotide-diphospho-sugar transferase domain-containing protein n=1 Tax=Sphaeroforma arctica JP610 TaxID=667725 RepID=A0A0L0G3F3_9EUKA|nr:hypothetical protein SARC_04136 [Sphaeroforma arctica JP610]KNC83637.1 hypothetical protein SARC_04136 [Sphaeroforma arctica JP610]|eukprot:XP_014157539.1 hypothetical protein SARC_04136 [Sphaeroforma arctica JP610]
MTSRLSASRRMPWESSPQMSYQSSRSSSVRSMIAGSIRFVHRTLRDRRSVMLIGFLVLIIVYKYRKIETIRMRERLPLAPWSPALSAAEREGLKNPPPLPCHPVAPEHQLQKRKFDRNGQTLENLLKQRAIDNMIIVTFASENQRILLRNFGCSLKRHHSNWIVIAYDKITADDVAKTFGSKSPHSYYDTTLLGDNMTSNFALDDDNKELVWRNLMHIKLSTVRAILDLGYEVMVADADTAVLRSITQSVQLKNQCDMQFQPDPKDVFDYEQFRGEHNSFNCGVYFVKPSAPVLRLYDAWLAAFNCEEGAREQQALRTALKRLVEYKDYHVFDPRTNTPFYYPSDLDGSSLVESKGTSGKREHITPGGVKMCYFHPRDFPNGGIYFLANARYRRVFGDDAPVVLHANYMKSKFYRKIEAFQTVGAWFMDDDLKCTEKQAQPNGKAIDAKELTKKLDEG